MNCDKARNLVALFPVSRLPIRLKSEVEDHLSQCPACARFAAAQEQLEQALPSALIEEAPAGFEFKVMDAVRRSGMRQTTYSLALSCLALLVLGAMLFWGYNQPLMTPSKQVAGWSSELTNSYETVADMLGTELIAASMPLSRESMRTTLEGYGVTPTWLMLAVAALIALLLALGLFIQRSERLERTEEAFSR